MNKFNYLTVSLLINIFFLQQATAHQKNTFRCFFWQNDEKKAKAFVNLHTHLKYIINKSRHLPHHASDVINFPVVDGRFVSFFVLRDREVYVPTARVKLLYTLESIREQHSKMNENI